MTTNEIIAKWLGLWETSFGEGCFFLNGKRITDKLDFLHDRNQQKWIIDELIKKGYGIEITYLLKVEEWSVSIYDIYLHDISAKCDDDLDQAFIECVLELITKEETK